MPFQVNPGAGINSHYEDSPSVGGSPPQLFSFKESSRSQGAGGGFSLLNICPSSFKQFMQSDIGYQLLYSYAKSQGITQKSIDANSVFDNLPTLQIREYAIDSELDQLLNLFRDLVNVFNPGDKNAPSNSVKSDSTKGQTAEGAAVSESKSVADKIKGIWEKITNKLKDNGFYDTICSAGNVDIYTNNYSSSPERNKVLRFPFAVYYRLLSCVTTNVYEVPVHPDVIIQSKSEGFEADQYKVEFPGQGAIGSIPIIGKVISRVMSTIAINTSPVWDPSKTTNTGPTTVCKFKLFNDTVEAAINNFIFVNTITANNMWYNYSIFKRAPALYDIRINGVYRFFMCTADITIKPAGPVRKVPMSLLKQLFGKHSGNATNSGVAASASRKADKNAEETQNAQDNAQKQANEDLDNALDAYYDCLYYGDEISESDFSDAVSNLQESENKLDEAKKQNKIAQEKKQNASNNMKNVQAASAGSAADKELVSIPDIYDVELSFTSMLPNNFNNFLYVYAGNPDVMQSDKGYQSNIVVKFIEAIKSIVTA